MLNWVCLAPEKSNPPPERCIWRMKGTEQWYSQLQSLTCLRDGLIHSALNRLNFLKIKSRERRWKGQGKVAGCWRDSLAHSSSWITFALPRLGGSFPIFFQLCRVLLPPNSPTSQPPPHQPPSLSLSKCSEEAGMMDNRCSLTYCVIHHTTVPIPLTGPFPYVTVGFWVVPMHQWEMV